MSVPFQVSWLSPERGHQLHLIGEIVRSVTQGSALHPIDRRYIV